VADGHIRPRELVRHSLELVACVLWQSLCGIHLARDLAILEPELTDLASSHATVRALDLDIHRSCVRDEGLHDERIHALIAGPGPTARPVGVEALQRSFDHLTRCMAGMRKGDPLRGDDFVAFPTTAVAAF